MGPMLTPFYIPGYMSPEYSYPQSDANAFPLEADSMRDAHDALSKNANSDKSSTNSNLFVFHLPASVDDNALFALFAPFGSLQSVRVSKYKTSSDFSGYGRSVNRQKPWFRFRPVPSLLRGSSSHLSNERISVRK